MLKVSDYPAQPGLNKKEHLLPQLSEKGRSRPRFKEGLVHTLKWCRQESSFPPSLLSACYTGILVLKLAPLSVTGHLSVSLRCLSPLTSSSIQVSK